MGQLGDLSPQASVAIGIIVGLISTSVQSLGLTLQRKSHILEDEKHAQDTRRPPYRRRRWQLGMLMFIISNLVGSTIQITTLPLPVLSTLQAAGLVFNSICATLILGEAFTRFSLGGTILVSGGAVLIALFGAIGEPSHTLDQLLVLLGRSQFVVWMAGQAVIVIAILAGIRALGALNPYSNNSPRMRLVRGMAYGCLSGILSAHSLLVAKSAVELLVQTLGNGNNQFNRWQSWTILLGLLALALSQLYFLHRGLKLCSTSILYPFVFCVYNIIAIIDGLIYFNQFSRLSTLSACLIALGTMILLGGVVCLSWRLDNDPSSNTAVPQSTLAPGLGFVPDSTDVSSTSSLLDDEESRLLSTPPPISPPLDGLEHKPTKRATFADYGSTFTPRRIASNPVGRPTSQNGPNTPRPFSAHRARRRTIAEANEIWSELIEDPFRINPFAFSHHHRRRTGVQTPPARVGIARTQSANATVRSDDETREPLLADNEASAESVSGNRNGEEALEEEPRPLSRSRTGRTYRDRDRRRSAPGVAAVERRREAAGSQQATGGLWKMRSWWKGNGDRAKHTRSAGTGDRDIVGNGDGG